MANDLLAEIRAMRTEITELKKPVVNGAVVLNGDGPFARKGESVMTSRPFRFVNMLGILAGAVAPEDAKVEFSAMENFRKAMEETRTGYKDFAAKSWAYPADYSYLPDMLAYHNSAREMKSLVHSRQRGVGPDHVHR